MNRRLFLKSTSSLLTASSFVSPLFFFPKRAWAGSNDHFFVLVQVNNGWDVTLSLDPKTHQKGHGQKDMFIEYQSDEISNKNGLTMGPSFAPMIKHSEDLHIIRGIEMRRDAGHTTNLEIISSGYGDGFSAAIPVELSLATQSGPLGVMIDRSLNTGNHSAILTEIQSIQNNSSMENMLSMMLQEDENFSFGKAQKGLIEVDSQVAKIQETLAKLDLLGIYNQQHKALMAAFLSKSAFQGSLTIDAELDTHSAHVDVHKANQQQAWNDVSELFDAFKAAEYDQGESLFDRTTFLVVSEFARTSALNSGAGKDHNPHANSILLAGKGVQGGKATGESFVIGVKDSNIGFAEHISRPIDFNSGKIIREAGAKTDTTRLIHPENVSATVGAIFGSPSKYYSPKAPALVIPGVVKI